MCLFIGQSGEVVQRESVSAFSADSALESMSQTLRHRPGVSSVEIWREGQLALRMTLNELAKEPHFPRRYL